MSLRHQLKSFWHFLRQVSGDDAYERYIAHHRQAHAGETALTRQQLYQRRQEEKWSKVSRCC